MPRLGELLVAAGLVSPESVEQALRAQVAWGGRLGTNLVELHSLDLDTLSRTLGKQHKLPAALAKHFEKADPALQRLLSPDFAERFSCVPLLRMGPEQHIVVASIAPLTDKQLAIVADELAVDVTRLVPAIAAELRIRYQLERVYNIRRAARFLRAHGTSIPPVPAPAQLPAAEISEVDIAPLPTDTREMAAYIPEDEELLPVEVVDPDAPPPDDEEELELSVLESVPEPVEDEATQRERRRYVPTIIDPQDGQGGTDRIALVGRVAIRKVAVGSAPRTVAGATLGEATRAVRRSTDRDRVGELAVDTLDRFAPGCEAAILLVIRGATAIGWKGFVRDGGGLGEIAVPLAPGGLVQQAIESNTTTRAAKAELSEIDTLLLGSLGDTAELAVVPISISTQVMCVIAMALTDGTAIATAESVAAAAGAAFARLMRDASR